MIQTQLEFSHINYFSLLGSYMVQKAGQIYIETHSAILLVLLGSRRLLTHIDAYETILSFFLGIILCLEDF